MCTHLYVDIHACVDRWMIHRWIDRQVGTHVIRQTDRKVCVHSFVLAFVFVLLCMYGSDVCICIYVARGSVFTSAAVDLHVHHIAGTRREITQMLRNSFLGLPGLTRVPKIMAQYPKIESIGSMGSIIWAILEVQVSPMSRKLLDLLEPRSTSAADTGVSLNWRFHFSGVLRKGALLFSSLG